jgi:hypothetical protein
MISRYYILLFLLVLTAQVKAQQYGLFGTKTSFDAFENVAQKAFLLDSSRQYASNFLLPNFGVNSANKGDSEYTVRSLLSQGLFSTRGIPLGEGRVNRIYANLNKYILTFLIFKSYKFNKELGFAWQVRSDVNLDYTNESLAILDNYRKFNSNQRYTDLFNNRGYSQSYNQFSVNYRENWDKRLAFGIKFSLLSGINYNKLDINNSSLIYTENGVNSTVDVGLKGAYRSNVLTEDEADVNLLYPNFKNPGASISLGTTYTSKKGITLIGNIKDLGFIKWNKNSHDIKFNVPSKVIKQLNTLTYGEFNNELTGIITDKDNRKGFYTLTNAKADFLISKTFDFYIPSLIISKNLFYRGGDIAFVNNFKYKDFSLSLIPDYNLNQFFMVGAQTMYKTPNFEFFLGSDNIGKSISIRQDAVASNGYNGGSFYMGVNIKFGYTVEHPLNSSYMPGLNDQEETGFFKRIFSIFHRN